MKPIAPNNDPYKQAAEAEANLTKTQKRMSDIRSAKQEALELRGKTGHVEKEYNNEKVDDGKEIQTRIIRGEINGHKVEVCMKQIWTKDEKSDNTVEKEEEFSGTIDGINLTKADARKLIFRYYDEIAHDLVEEKEMIENVNEELEENNDYNKAIKDVL